MIVGRWTLSRRQLLVTGALVAGLLVVVARWAAVLAPPSTAPAAAAGAGAGVPGAAGGAARLVVHVVGAVRRPGLYRFQQGKRVADALSRAGGASAKADLELINLAAPLADGQQVVVPRRLPPAPAGDAGAGPGASRAGGPVHLNMATLADLDALPGIGPVTAQKILDYRQEHGAFSSVDELDAVSGIGPARLEELRKVVAP